MIVADLRGGVRGLVACEVRDLVDALGDSSDDETASTFSVDISATMRFFAECRSSLSAFDDNVSLLRFNRCFCFFKKKIIQDFQFNEE